MARPPNCLCKNISFEPNVVYFKPQGIPLRKLEGIELSMEELEACRLSYLMNLDQTEASKLIKTSQSTYQRILQSAYQKIADALVNGKAIKIIKHSRP